MADSLAVGDASVTVSRDDELDEALVSLCAHWYLPAGGAPVDRLGKVSALTGADVLEIWTTLWFAKNELTAPLDEKLRSTYGRLYDSPFLARAIASAEAPLPEPPDHLSAHGQLLWLVGLVVLCDQVSRNVFRGSARAYATDGLARRLCEAHLRARFDSLPPMVGATVALVYIHSEDPADWRAPDVVGGLIERLKPTLGKICPHVFEVSLTGIAQNHRDSMQRFGRVAQRNQFLGRKSTEAELAFLAAMGL